MVLDEAEHLGLQGGVWAVDERLQGLAAGRHDLVAEHHQHVAQDGEGLRTAHSTQLWVRQ